MSPIIGTTNKDKEMRTEKEREERIKRLLSKFNKSLKTDLVLHRHFEITYKDCKYTLYLNIVNTKSMIKTPLRHNVFNNTLDLINYLDGIETGLDLNNKFT